MDALFEPAHAFSGWLWRTTWQGSVLIVLVLLAQWLLGKRITARWRYALWLLVVVRLALPFSLESRVSVFNWLRSKPWPRRSSEFWKPSTKSTGESQ